MYDITVGQWITVGLVDVDVDVAVVIVANGSRLAVCILQLRLEIERKTEIRLNISSFYLSLNCKGILNLLLTDDDNQSTVQRVRQLKVKTS